MGSTLCLKDLNTLKRVACTGTNFELNSPNTAPSKRSMSVTAILQQLADLSLLARLEFNEITGIISHCFRHICPSHCFIEKGHVGLPKLVRQISVQDPINHPNG